MMIKNVRRRPQPPESGLAGLAGVPLSYELEQFLAAALAGSGGSPEWRHRKDVECREILALSRLAPRRLRVDQLELGEALRAVIYLSAPVPMPHPRRLVPIIRPRTRMLSAPGSGQLAALTYAPSGPPTAHISNSPC